MTENQEPWTIRELYGKATDVQKNKVTIPVRGFALGQCENSEANTRHIVKCVNMHTELVEALRPLVSSHHIDDKCQCNKCIGRRVLIKATKEG